LKEEMGGKKEGKGEEGSTSLSIGANQPLEGTDEERKRKKRTATARS